MIQIKLNQSAWEYDPNQPLGPEGGFGEVFLGLDTAGTEVAVKRLKVGPDKLAHREMEIAEELSQPGFENVIRVFDYGIDAQSNNYFLVMVLAEYSLENYIEKSGSVTSEKAVEILINICNGLSETHMFVHRDLKPGNILFRDDKWMLSDFGIARFIEKSTSARTLKDFLSPHYAAPEQWNFEHATSATDIYGLGCICYFLLTGSPPFKKSEISDLKEAHLQHPPPTISGIPNRLRSLIGMMLRKNPETRPAISRILTILRDIQVSSKKTDDSIQWDSIQKADAEVVEEHTAIEAKRETVRLLREKRKALHTESLHLLESIKSDFFKKLSENVPSIQCIGRTSASLGKATITIEHSVRTMFDENTFSDTQWDFISAGEIWIEQSQPKYRWGASLLFGSPKAISNYRWYEVSFFSNAFAKKNTI